MATVLITRRWVQITNFRHTRWCWTYDYALNAGRPPAVSVEYGTSLTELDRMLRFKKPGQRIVRSWEAGN